MVPGLQYLTEWHLDPGWPSAAGLPSSVFTSPLLAVPRMLISSRTEVLGSLLAVDLEEAGFHREVKLDRLFGRVWFVLWGGEFAVSPLQRATDFFAYLYFVLLCSFGCEAIHNLSACSLWPQPSHLSWCNVFTY